MTFVVTESCIKCKLTDCVEVCPVDFLAGGTQRAAREVLRKMMHET